jgi:hypothetical protein
MKYKNFLYDVKDSELLQKTLDRMNQLENDSLRDKEFVDFVRRNFDCKDKDVVFCLYEVHRWVYDNISYIKDAYDETLISPKAIVHFRYGDCDDFALLTHTILKILNIPVRYVLLAKQHRGYSHIAVAYKFENVYIYIDATQRVLGILPKLYKNLKII